MKRVFQIASVFGCLAFLCGCGSTPGFEPEEPDDPVQPEISSDSVYVKLCTGGELQITTEPLGRATSDRDLFALNVFSEQEKYEGTTENISGYFTPYAYGYFDDLNLVILKLAKSRYYHFALAYIPNGKDVCCINIRTAVTGTHAIAHLPRMEN